MALTNHLLVDSTDSQERTIPITLIYTYAAYYFKNPSLNYVQLIPKVQHNK